MALLMAGGLSSPAFAQAAPQVTISHEITTEGLNTAELAAFDQVANSNPRMSHELARLSRVVGKEGKLTERAYVPNASGFWRDSAESINSLIADLVHPTSEVARVIGAVAQGDRQFVIVATRDHQTNAVDKLHDFKGDVDTLFPIDSAQHYQIRRSRLLLLRQVRLYQNAIRHLEDAPA
jgi:chromosome segregation ATPase